MNGTKTQQSCLKCSKILPLESLKKIAYDLCICLDCIDKSIQETTTIFKVKCQKCNSLKNCKKIGSTFEILGNRDLQDFICSECQ